jgi:hypothetical protein
MMIWSQTALKSELRFQNTVALCPSIECFEYPNCGVSVVAVAGRHLIGAHHADASSLDDRAPVDAWGSLQSSPSR